MSLAIGDHSRSVAAGTDHPSHLWVSYRSAASLFDLGVTIADVPEFISDRHLQPKADVKIRLRSGGLERGQWTVHDGFAVTTPARTIADLAEDHMDGGHQSRIASDALTRSLVTELEVGEALVARRPNSCAVSPALDASGCVLGLDERSGAPSSCVLASGAEWLGDTAASIERQTTRGQGRSRCDPGAGDG